MKILYVPGPLNAVRTYELWAAGRDDPSSVAIPYLYQFFDLCKQLDVESVVCSSVDLDEASSDGSQAGRGVEIRSVLVPFQSSSGLLFHLGQFLYLFRVGMIAVKKRANVIVITAARSHLFALFPFALMGITVIPTLHCTFWPKLKQPTGLIKRIVLKLNGIFLRQKNSPILAFPGEVSHQVIQLTNLPPDSIFNFLPSYKKYLFADIKPPSLSTSRFRVLYLGRVTKDKGVYTIVDVASRLLAAGGQGDFVFDICGDGPELMALRQHVDSLNLSSSVRCHGFCDRPKVVEMLGKSHAIIVPTTTSFIEGFNKVVVEGVLASRPVITSTVCPSLETVRQAVVEVEAENVDSYLQAILKLQQDQNFYQQKQDACSELQEQFYDSSSSWSNQLAKALASLNHSGLTP